MSRGKPIPIVSHQRVEEIFSLYYREVARKIDRLFVCLFLAQWLGAVGLALWVSPFAWAAAGRSAEIHLYSAIFLGGVLAALPVYLGLKQPGETLNRYVNAVAQISFSILFIHLTGGRIETHFHLFGSLAFLAFYRDWRVLLLASVVTAADHVVRGMFWPESIYGVLSAGLARALEHSAWVIFEDVVLYFSIQNGLKELRAISEKQATLEQTIASIEDQVHERTEKLLESERTVMAQHQALLSSAKMSALGEMAGGVAHEINNPLAIIMAVSSQLEEVVQDPTIDKNLVVTMSGTITRTASRIAKIVAGLKTFSRDGNQDPFGTVKVTALIEHTVGLCAERFRNSEVLLTVEPFASELAFEGRETQISQVLLNLLGNSFDAISIQANKWIKISVADAENFVKIMVTDSGTGVPIEIQKKIFQPFFTTKEVGKGTGMGLSISHGILKSHQGTLTLNEACPNTCFVITLPKIRAAFQKQAA